MSRLHRRMPTAHLLILAVVGCSFGLISVDSVGAAENAKTKTLAIGDRVDDLYFKDIRYLPRSISEMGDAEAYVIAFTTLDCPLVQRYLPRLVEIEREYRDRGVQFVAINVGPGDAIVEIADQALRVGAEFIFGKDFSGEAATIVGATRTPECVVLDSDRVIRYRGRIDSQYRLGGVSPNPGRLDLKEAIDDVLAGQEVEIAETAVDGCRITFAPEPDLGTSVTYTEHVSRIMQKHCQECHRPGATAPFALLDYDSAVDHAEMIDEVVREQRMPPRFAAEPHDEIVNLRMLDADEREMVAAWIAGGCERGDPAKLPEPIEFPDTEWRNGEPDLVTTMSRPEKIPADGYVPYRYAILPQNFEHDTWVRGIEIRPGNRRVVHHANLLYLPGDQLLNRKAARFITGHVPGGDATWFNDDQGFKIPKGSKLVLQLHYVTIGEETDDASSVGLTFCDGPIEKEVKHFLISNYGFAIPPGHPHHRVAADATFDTPATGLGMFSHMHLRGKDMTFTAHYPDGTAEQLLSVPNYNFDWQMSYRWAENHKKFPAGTKIEVVAHFDNSDFNPYNPDPSDTVKYGPQTYHEMMMGFFFYTEDPQNMDLVVDGKTGKAVTDAQSGD